MRWYLRYGLSYRDVEELLAERGIEVDHVTIYRWVQTFTPEFIDAARPARHATGDRWFVDETYVKVAGRWTYLYRAVDQHGQVIDVLVSTRRDAAAARAVLHPRAACCGPSPVEVTTDRAPVYPRVLDELVAGARHVIEQYANNVVEADHGRLKARLRPMRGLKRLASARTVAAGHAFVQNLRRGHYDIVAEQPRTTGSAPPSTNSRSASDSASLLKPKTARTRSTQQCRPDDPPAASPPPTAASPSTGRGRLPQSCSPRDDLLDHQSRPAQRIAVRGRRFVRQPPWAKNRRERAEHSDGAEVVRLHDGIDLGLRRPVRRSEVRPDVAVRPSCRAERGPRRTAWPPGEGRYFLKATLKRRKLS